MVMHQRNFDVIVSAHEAAAAPLLLCRRIGLLRTPIVVLSVALLSSENLRPRRRRVLGFLLQAASAVTVYSASQQKPLSQTYNLPLSRVRLLAFGVDCQFFSPATNPSPPGSPLLISVGTNQGKDYRTLLAALPPDLDVTIVTDAANREIVARFRNSRVRTTGDVPIQDLRELYRRATVVVVPLLDGLMSSGQTVLLENFAMASAVVVSKAASVDDYIEPGVNCLAPEPVDTAEMNQAIERLLANEGLRAELGRQARDDAVHLFSANKTAAALVAILEEVSSLSERKGVSDAAYPSS